MLPQPLSCLRARELGFHTPHVGVIRTCFTVFANSPEAVFEGGPGDKQVEAQHRETRG